MSDDRRAIFENHNPLRVKAVAEAINTVPGLNQADLCIMAAQSVSNALAGLSTAERWRTLPVIMEFVGEMLLEVDKAAAATDPVDGTTPGSGSVAQPRVAS